MAARVTKCNGTVIAIETTVGLSGSMLKADEAIQTAINETGVVATGEALKRFDADGDPIVVGGVKWYAKVPEEVLPEGLGVEGLGVRTCLLPPRL